ncbi:MAG: polysaccharide pyruvyl transferase family protein [Pseudomonadales bacterium]
MKAVTLFDTAIASTNLGDQIIMDAASSHIRELYQDAFIYSVVSHEWLGSKSRGLVKQSDCSLTCGTNMLSSRMWFKPLWKLTPLDAFRNLNVTLMGAGWYQFQSKPDIYTRFLLNNVLSKHSIHSVRDGYTQSMLQTAGISNVLNTGCPTLWRLSTQHCEQIPQTKSSYVITTLNTYIENRQLDGRLLKTLHQHYDKVYFWIQTATDYDYARSLDANLIYLPPSLQGLDELLDADIGLDYVGNRLHAGIRAMQKMRRTIILEVDNRAKEMGSDFDLPTVERNNFDQLETMITGDFSTRLQLPYDAINQWKAQWQH